ncbi:MAG: PepSY-associated TM helix domain-containing protein [Halofilum sp. (in: g-proteobacteria)]|nr:PepSY-associated TM helix domain-containing protein [Halofilum sp. (in: g-proteobacteria)]
MRHRARLRRSWLTIHRSLGLCAGLLVVGMGLTGSLLVFDHAIDEWLNPDLLLTDGQGPRIEPDRARDAIVATAPEGHYLSWLSAPRTAQGVYRGYTGPRGDGFWRSVSVDPVSGEVLGSRRLGDNLMSAVYELHYRLLVGALGETIVGFIGLAALLSLCTGLYLWWPRLRHLEPAFTIKRRAASARRQFDLHRTTAIYSLPVIGIIVVTGIFLAWTAWLAPVVDRVAPLTDPAAEVAVERADARERIGPSRAIATAREVLPHAQWSGIGLPATDSNAYRVAFAEPAHPRASTGRSYVWVHPWSGDVLAVRRWSELSAGDKFLDWQIPLHNGEAFGLTGRIVVFVAGFVPLILFITGFRIWRLKRRAASRNPHRRGGTANERE